MDFISATKPLIMEGQYLAYGNFERIKWSLFDLAKWQMFICSVKTHPQLSGRVGEFDLLCLDELFWGECFEVEIIGLDGFQTLVRFYISGEIELSEIEVHQQALRNRLTHRIDLWFFENLGWTRKIYEILAEELYNHRLASLRNFQREAVSRLGLITYPMADFQCLPAPQIGIPQIQPGSPQPQVGISQIQPDNPQQLVGISQSQPDSPRPWAEIFQKPADTLQTQVGVGWGAPREHPVEEIDVPFTRDDQELLRLWADGLTAKEIGMRTGKTGKTVTNRLSVLRRMYGAERIPLRKKPTRKDLG